MTVISVTPGTSRPDGAVKVEFSDGSSLLFSRDYLREEILTEEDSPFQEVAASNEAGAFNKAGRELSPGEEEAFRFAAACFRVEKAALKLIARAEQNSLGLTSKLESRGFDSRAVKAVVSRFLERNLLDDGRYAELWLRSRLSARKALSPRWLSASLSRRGIDRKSSAAAMEKVLDPETEYALLLGYIEKTGLKDAKTPGFSRARLKYEGFSPDVLERYYDE